MNSDLPGSVSIHVFDEVTARVGAGCVYRTFQALCDPVTVVYEMGTVEDNVQGVVETPQLVRGLLGLPVKQVRRSSPCSRILSPSILCRSLCISLSPQINPTRQPNNQTRCFLSPSLLSCRLPSRSLARSMTRSDLLRGAARRGADGLWDGPDLGTRRLRAPRPWQGRLIPRNKLTCTLLLYLPRLFSASIALLFVWTDSAID